MSSADAYLVVALHGHLPFIHHPEHEFFLEEDWLFEAISDCYLPLLQALDGWDKDGIGASITLGLSPPLLHMLAEPLLRKRTLRYLDARQTLIERFGRELPVDSPFRPALSRAREETGSALARYQSVGGDIAHAFAEHAHAGRLELMTCGATHGVFPVLLDEGSIDAQVGEAIRTHERHTGLTPRGIWSPECGVTPVGLSALARAGLIYTFTEDRAVRFSNPPPQYDAYRPLYSPEGVACFPRDPVAAVEVWSADDGYPGDHRYREFYRDLGYDAREALLDDAHKQGTGDRKNVGVKLHGITGKVSLDDKGPYSPAAADAAVQGHAEHFATRRIEDARNLREALDVAPCMTASFDAELFGHWWHEGPRFLDLAIRALWARKDEPGVPAPVSVVRFLEAEPKLQVAQPAVSSWGDGGAFSVWVNPQNDWLWRKVLDGRMRLGAMVRGFSLSSPLAHRALRQATREVMLAQSSDWPFILAMDTQTGYGQKRPLVHLSRAHRLLDMLEAGNVDEADLSQMEARDGVFPDVDVSAFAHTL